MDKQWQNRHIREEFVPVQGGGPSALDPPDETFKSSRGGPLRW